MAVRSKSQFEALYGTSGTEFPDNTVGTITALKQRAMGQDIADSFKIASGIQSGVTAGSGTYTTTISGVGGYADGDTYSVKFASSNGGAATININSLGPRSLKKAVSIDLAIGDLLAGGEYIIAYDGTNFQVLGLSVDGTISDVAFAAAWNGDNTSAPTKNVVFDALAGLQTKVIEIGDWDMVSTLNIDVTHGVTAKNIRSIDVIIRDDFDENYDKLDTCGTTSGVLQGWIELVRTSGLNTTIRLRRLASGYFATTAYDATSFNRGWITITYVAS